MPPTAVPGGQEGGDDGLRRERAQVVRQRQSGRSVSVQPCTGHLCIRVGRSWPLS